MSFKVKLPDGAVDAPSITFENDPDSGLYLIEAGRLGIAVGGVKVGEFDSNGLKLTYNRRADYAAIYQTGNASATVIRAQNVYTEVVNFDTDLDSAVSTADAAGDHVDLGDTRPYMVGFSISADVDVGGAELEFAVYQINDSEAVTITGISQADPGVVTAVGHGFENGDRVTIESVVGMVEVNNQIYTVANKADDTFELTGEGGVNVNTGGYTAYDSGGVSKPATKVVELDQDFPNGTIGQASAQRVFMGTVTDKVELFVRNLDNANDVTVHEAQLWVTGI